MSTEATHAGVDVVRLKGAWLVLAHMAWAGIFVICLVLAVVGIFVRFQVDTYPCESNPARGLTYVMLDCEAWQAASAEMGLSLGFIGAFFLALRVVAILPFFALAVILVARRSADLRILLLSVVLVVVGAMGNWYTSLVDWARYVYPILYQPGAMVSVLANCAWLFGYLFPDGRFVPRWTRWTALVIVPLAVGMGFFMGTALDFRTWPFPAPQAINLLLFGTSVYAIVYRYRFDAGLLQRQQIKWIMSSFSLLFFLFFLDIVVLDLYPGVTGNAFPFPSMRYWVARDLLQQLAWNVAHLLLVIAIGFSFFRYRLYDIDVIIRRTLIYGSLSVVLALIYFGSVVLLQTLLRPLLGSANDLTIVGSTLALIVLFQPLRRRIQVFIDRRFYRQRYDATKTLQRFSTYARNEVDIHSLSGMMLDVVQETLQPTTVSLWLPSKDSHRNPA